MADNTSLENQALNQPNYMAPAPVVNQQQISNFLSALKQSGAGSNNSFMSSGAPAIPQQQQLVQSPQPIPPWQSGIQGNYGRVNPNLQSINQNQVPNVPPIQQQYGQQQYGNGVIDPSYNQAVGGYNQQGYNPGQAYNPNQGYSNQLQSSTYNPYQYQSQQSQQQQAPQQVQAQQIPQQSQVPIQNRQAVQVQAPISQNLQMRPSMLTSDETAKTNIKPAEIQNFMDHLHAWEYEYKDKTDGQGKFIGPMAQEIVKTGARDAIMKDANGKLKVDTQNPRLKMFELAALAHLNEQFKNIQKEFYKLKKAK